MVFIAKFATKMNFIAIFAMKEKIHCKFCDEFQFHRQISNKFTFVANLPRILQQKYFVAKSQLLNFLLFAHSTHTEVEKRI